MIDDTERLLNLIIRFNTSLDYTAAFYHTVKYLKLIYSHINVVLKN